MDQFVKMQQNRTHLHPNLLQPGPSSSSDVTDKTTAATEDTLSSSCSFIVVADTQLGMITEDKDWTEEIYYSTKAIEQINQLSPRPLFCCICGDLVNMTSSIYTGMTKPTWAQRRTTLKKKEEDNDDEQQQQQQQNDDDDDDKWTEIECNEIRDRQVIDFKKLWCTLHPDIALVCLCGNHDVGNRPTLSSIQQYTKDFGNDYLSFWIRNTTIYCIVINSSLLNDPSGIYEYYEQQLQWLDERLEYAQTNNATQVFIFTHHPIFIYNENETATEYCTGVNIYNDVRIPDAYFHIPLERRKILLNIIHKYKKIVKGIFSGHYHQNMISTTSEGIPMIITGSLSCVLQSNGVAVTNHPEPKTQGYRIVNFTNTSYTHQFISIE